MDDRSALENFFTQLRKVGLATERGVTELIEDYDNNTKRCPSKAILKLSDLKKEVKETKVDVRGKMEHMQQTGQAFDEFLGLCGSLIAKQKAAVQDIETFMQQYGYTPKVTEKPKGNEEEEMDMEATDDTSNGDAVCTPPPCRQEVQDTSKTPKTPVMEHTRLQSYKMKAVAASNTNTAMYSVQPVSRSHQVPPEFENDGLFVTPSLMGDKKLPLQTPDAHQTGHYGSPYPMWSPAASDMPSHQKIPRLDLNSHASVDLTSPEFQTPSMRRLAQMSSACNPDVQKLSKAVSEQMMACSPASPTFQTPNLKNLLLKKNTSIHKPCPIPNPGIGVKNLVKSDPLDFSVKTPPISRIYTTETPKTPEMTCDLSKLRGMANTFSYEPVAFSSVSGRENSSIRSGFPEPPKLSYLQSQSDTPKTPELTHNFQSFRGLSHAPVPKFESLAERLGQNLPSETPPTPDMLTTRLDQLKAERSSHKPKTTYGTLSSHGDLDSPQLLGTYNFRTSKENVPPRP
ncbi:spindle and kinetochore-associated protein 3-like [Mizuhopecten yessoensis]|uniref:Spindle and kinetochore-associated protein 3 n=1 Tax=Mizuhopecten yessoensis TaxID=6573 RepID=A0A210Q8H2_MIZYE|nr:spindle and kinetochore-associated protein 3-like [Mizuhopecten yessoensis]XP_021364620.1 spindle and kinetochore-associated protein 3-like [Mizuhopecten yessoensis]XP_021364621.1 spindle and kinetochore-associated protein 3-like [Mizuhopecten yessoensis]OWF45024.1 Spindle and kinetochore-associated protein 3 [Mizuhopecten yessoensis]